MLQEVKTLQNFFWIVAEAFANSVEFRGIWLDWGLVEDLVGFIF